MLDCVRQRRIGEETELAISLPKESALFYVVRQVPWRNDEYPITIAELSSASKDLSRLLTEDERNDLSDFLAFDPGRGDVMPRTGGIRKARWPYMARGKRSGLRVIYYFHDLNMPLYILAVYAKGEKLNLTAREEREMARLVRTLVKDNVARKRERQNIQERSA